MRVYRNVKTGAVVLTPCEVRGTDWIEETEKAAPRQKGKKETTEKE